MVSHTQKLPSAGLANFIKSKLKSGKEPRTTRSSSEDDVSRDWVQHSALKLAFEDDFKAPLQRLLKAGGCEVLDIGCGAGFWTMDMAARYPISYFTGVDNDKSILPSTSIPKNALFQCINITDLPLPFEDNTFDFVFIRSMVDCLADDVWDAVLPEIVRIMKKGAFLECIEAYPSLFDAGPAMTDIAQLATDLSRSLHNPWPNRLAVLHLLSTVQIQHADTPVGTHGGSLGTLLIEYWERIVRSSRCEWIHTKRISEKKLDKIIATLRSEVDEYQTHMSWYSVVAQKKGYTGPLIQFEDCEDLEDSSPLPPLPQ